MTEKKILFCNAGKEAAAFLFALGKEKGIAVKQVLPFEYEKTLQEVLDTPQLPGASETAVGFPEMLILLNGFTMKELDPLLDRIRTLKETRQALKAVVTEHNRSWTILHLRNVLYQEMMDLKKQQEKAR